MTDYLVYDTEEKAQAACDDLWAKYGPTVNETDLDGKPTGKEQVTVRWSAPMQRKDGKWIVHEHPTLTVDAKNAALSKEPHDASWFDDPTVKKA